MPKSLPDLDIQDVQLYPDIALVLRVHLNAMDVAEVGQQAHQVGPGVDDMTDAIAWPHQQGHFSVPFPLL